jgi:hypothetical protein
VSFQCFLLLSKWFNRKESEQQQENTSIHSFFRLLRRVDLYQQPAIVAQNVQRRLLRLQLLGNDRQLILTYRTRLNAR